MNTLKNISENYKFQSKKLGLSEAEVAERSEMPLEVIRNIEAGIEFRIMPIYRVAEVLGMTIDEFVAPPKDR